MRIATERRPYKSVVRFVFKLNYIERSGAPTLCNDIYKLEHRTRSREEAPCESTPEVFTARSEEEGISPMYAKLRGALRGTGSAEHVSEAT